MNQARSTYKTDYVPYDWMQNNFTSNAQDFCSSDNVDDCLKYISREFSALGYPSIYTNENASAFPVNCDIVKLMNATYELLGNCSEYAQAKEDLECRNRGLVEDLKALNRKNSLLKESLEQLDRKYKSALEKERQSKEKNKELTQLLKIEKDESKRLASQMQQQKKTYQHEIRKSENNMSQMKSRLNQILSDKNPNKKIANITSPNLLQRNSNQRGKWKTGSVAKSNFEEMYKSVISSYETRCQDMLKEISAFHGCLDFIQSQMLETILLLKVDGNDDNMWFSDLTPLQAVLNGKNLQKSLEERFAYLLERLKDSVFQQSNCNTKKTDTEDFSLKSKEFRCTACKTTEQAITNETINQEPHQSNSRSNLHASSEKLEKENLKKEKSELAATISLIEKEKKELEVQKLDVIKMALHREVQKSQWHQNLNTVPSFSVIQTISGLTAIPCAKQLRNCLSAPDQQIQSLAPLWRTEPSKKSVEEPISESVPQISPHISPPIVTEVPKESDPGDTGLPKWAMAAIKSPPLSTEAQSSETATAFENSFSNDEVNVSTVSSSEEQNLTLFNSAMKDIESRRKQVSM